MPDGTKERVEAIAKAARIAIEPGSAERIAGAVAIPVNRLAKEDIALPLEVEPSTFMAVQQREIGR